MHKPQNKYGFAKHFVVNIFAFSLTKSIATKFQPIPSLIFCLLNAII